MADSAAINKFVPIWNRINAMKCRIMIIGIFCLKFAYCSHTSTEDLLSGKFANGPVLTGLQAIAYNQVEAQFSMIMDSKTAIQVANYQISDLNIVNVAISATRADTVVIQTGVQKSLQSYKLTVQNLFSASGLAGRTDTRNFLGFNSVGTSVLVDRSNGTVFESSRNLVWLKCTLGQQYNSNSNDCTGTGNAGNDFGAAAYTYCNETDNDCNNGTSGATLTAPFLNNGASQLYNACNAINTNPAGGYAGITTWRVPTLTEQLALLKSDQSPHIDTSKFPQNSTTYYYWSASSDPGNSQRAYDIDFAGGTVNNNVKTTGSVVRCVSSN